VSGGERCGSGYKGKKMGDESLTTRQQIGEATDGGRSLKTTVATLD
jgi:hypothetical protein